jgi:hypothetical protein
MATSEKDLLAQIAELKGQLAESEKAKTEAQEMATSIAAASSFMGTAEEQPTGNIITINVCLNPGEKDEKKQKFKDVDFPTFYYTIDIPAGAGVSLMTNGTAYYHGQTYEVDQATLVDLKSRVARCWDHEKSIHSENANAYRKPSAKHLISPAAAQRGAH